MCPRQLCNRTLLAPQALKERKEALMFLILALILVLAWIGGFVVFHVAGFFIHLLLILAVISIIMHFVRGAAAKA
jgi:hypothetical protein